MGRTHTGQRGHTMQNGKQVYEEYRHDETAAGGNPPTWAKLKPSERAAWNSVAARQTR